MVQNKIIQVDVAFLTYDPKRCSDTPQVKQDNACVIGLEELKKHREIKRRDKDKMGSEAYHHYKWYNSMLCYELKSNTENIKLKVIHWHIQSGNMDAFMLNGKLYKSVSIVIGDIMEHWYCANNGKDGSRSYGSRYRKADAKLDNKTNKLAIFTIDDDEATFVMRDDWNMKCSPDVCANNCIECKKFQSPFSKSNKDMPCACYPSKNDFKRIEESDMEEELDSDDDDIAAQSPPSFFGRKYFQGGKFMLKAICEE